VKIDREKICALVSGERAVFDQIPPEKLSDGLGRKHGNADVLVYPQSTEEVSALMAYAYAERIPVTVRGAGTGITGATVPLYGGIVLDMSRMNHMLELDAATMSTTVDPGVILEDFQKFVEERGFFYPPDPGEKTATLGGNIATNAGGMRAVKYGVTRDYVMSLEVVLADGTITTLGSKTVKDVSGLGLKHLVIGSEGTLAVITKATLRLMAKPERTLSVLIFYDSLAGGIKGVLDILHSGTNPTALEFLERSVASFGEEYTGFRLPKPASGREASAYILLTFDGGEAEVASAIAKTRKLVEKNALGYTLLEDTQLASDVWAVRGCLVKAVEAISEEEPLDMVVPINRSADFIGIVNKIQNERGLRMISFGHAGDGNVHLCVVRGNRDDETWKHDLDSALDSLYGEVHKLSGLCSGEHGIGIYKQPWFFRYTEAANIVLMNQVKNAFDPLHILNEGKSYVNGKLSTEVFT
jgi:glycolate oxidase